MKIEVTYTPADIYEAQKLHFFSSKYQYIYYALGIIELILLLILDLDLIRFVLLSSFAFFFLTYPFVALRLYSSYIFKKSPRLHTLVEFSIDENEVEIHAKNAMSKSEWSAFQRQRNNSKTLLLYPGHAFSIIPRRVLSEGEWSELVKLSKEKIVVHS